ncbi:MAG TPA: class I adenylate-forming enzyme family protein, partial [Phenylobacterium sp.]|nr:class I adenylate-forming enzyme family protein [Phenylobacterium sp.]
MTQDALPAGWPAMSIADANALITAPGSAAEVEEVVIRGIKTKTWKNLPPTLRSVVEAGRAHGEKVFLVYEDERVTYEAFYRAVARFAVELQGQGLKKGDRVAIIMRNLPEWPVAFYAAASLGAIVTPLNAWWTGPELEYGLTDSGSKIAVLDTGSYGRLAEHLPNCPDLQRIYVSREIDEIAHPQVTKLEAVIGGANEWISLPDQAIPPAEIDTDDDATIFYTSGTTGKPKGALATHRAVNSNIMAGAASGARAFLRRGEAPPAPDPDAPQRSSLISVPFFHATGCFAVLNPSLIGGAKLVMMHKWDVIRAFELIQRLDGHLHVVL